MRSLKIQTMGGVNYSDPSDTLMSRAFEMTNGGLVQKAPLEFISGNNMDFSRQLLRMRYGSTAYQSLAAIMQSGETLIAGTLFAGNVAGGTAYAEVIVGSKSIYINKYTAYAQGTFVQATRSGGVAYLHNATVAKATFTSTDGHLFIMLDGANSIQVYRDTTGTTLDDQLNGSATAAVATTYATTSNAAASQPVIPITTSLLGVGGSPGVTVGDRLLIHGDGADEYAVVGSIIANTSITLTTNLVNRHNTPATVTIQNKYTQSFGGATQIITGSWLQGYFLGMSLQQRLMFSRGDVQVEWCGPSNPWDRFNGGVLACDGPIVAMEAFTPRFANLLGAVGVFHTLADNAGLQYLSGFDPSDTLKTIAGASSPIGYQAVCVTMNWIMYLTRNRRIEATDLNRVVDVGRRLRGQDADASGPLNTINLVGSIPVAFSFYDARKRQAQFYFADNAATVVTDAMVVDMQLGEPTAFDNIFTDTGSYQFESSLRMLYWHVGGESSAQPWFVNMYQRLGAVVGITTSGALYTPETPNNGYDLDLYPIEFSAKSPDFTMGLPGIQKKWRRMAIRVLTSGVGNMSVDSFENRANVATPQLNWAFNQVPPGIATLGSTPTSFTLGVSLLGGGGMVLGHNWQEVAAEALAFQISVGSPRPPGFILATVDLMYQIANLQD